MSKIIKYSDEAREGIISGINQVADIVKITVGPKGRNVLIREALNTPIITNDGATIAKNIQLKDNLEDAGAALVKAAANKTNNVAGDGTTTTTILTQALIKQYEVLVRNNEADKKEPFNAVQVQKEMISASNLVNDYLMTKATPANDIDSIKRVAVISSGDENIGSLIADGFAQAGEFGTVIVEDNKSTDGDILESAQGMKFTNGMITSFLLKDRSAMKTEFQDCKVLVTTEQLDNIVALMPVLDACIKNNLRLLILCSDMSIETQNTIVMNIAQGIPLNIAVVRLPGFGQLKDDLTSDICLATGATLISRDTGRTLQSFTLDDLGEVKEVIVTQDDTILKFKDELVLTNGEVMNLLGDRQERAEELKARLEDAREDEKTQFKRRISNLLSGISVIKVGGNSEVEIKDKKLRIEDAINSVESAREEGIVPGGGYSFIMASEDLKDELEKTIGGKVVREALLEPTKQIAENVGEDGFRIVSECREKKLGYNALTGEFENLLETGIINSVKTDRYSLLNATSVASTVITTGGTIIEENEKDQNVLQLMTPNQLMTTL